jgi:hypothetical protein
MTLEQAQHFWALGLPGVLPPAGAVALLPAPPETLPLADGAAGLSVEPGAWPLAGGGELGLVVPVLPPVTEPDAPEELPGVLLLPGPAVGAMPPGVTVLPGGQSWLDCGAGLVVLGVELWAKAMGASPKATLVASARAKNFIMTCHSS